MYTYFQSSKASDTQGHGFITIFKLLCIALVFGALFYFSKYFDKSLFFGDFEFTKSIKMVPKITTCLVEIRGDKGCGTGFFAELKDKNFIVTNLHVLSGNKEIEFYNSNGEKVKVGNIFGAKDYDIALIQVDSPPSKLFIQEEINKQKLEGIKVIIPGNALGDGVFSAIRGKVMAVGPQLIEVDAKFVSGHSGSPIITKDFMGNYKVLGVATFTKTSKLQGRDQLSRYEDTRWYGYRLDNIQEWQRVSWDHFILEAEQLHKIEDRTENIIRFFTNGEGPLANDPDIIALGRDMQRSGIIGQRSIESYESTFKLYLKNILLKDIEQSRSYQYGYHNKRFEDQKRIREEMVNIIDQEIFFH